MLTELPQDLLYEILKFTQYVNYTNLAKTCQKISAALRNNNFWKRLCDSNKIIVKDDNYLNSAKLYFKPYWQWNCPEYGTERYTRLNFENCYNISISAASKRPLTVEHNSFSVRVIECKTLGKLDIGLLFMKSRYIYIKDKIVLQIGSVVKFSVDFDSRDKPISVYHNNIPVTTLILYIGPYNGIYATVGVPPGTILELTNEN